MCMCGVRRIYSWLIVHMDFINSFLFLFVVGGVVVGGGGGR
jgi:hypothetical protein